jgi:hypothetical protein
VTRQRLFIVHFPKTWREKDILYLKKQKQSLGLKILQCEIIQLDKQVI